MTRRIALALFLAGGLLAGCGGSDSPSPTSTATDAPPTPTIAAAGTDVPRSVPPTLVPASVVLTVSRQAIGANEAEKLTLPVKSADDIVGALGYRTIFDLCGYLAFVARPGATLVSPVDGVVNTKYDIPLKDPLTGHKGGLAVGITMPSGNSVDIYFGDGSTSDLVVGATVTRGQVIGIHSGTEFSPPGANTVMTRSSVKKVCVTTMASPEEWVGGSPSLLAP